MTLNQAPLPHGEKPAQHPRSRANLTQHRPSTRAGDFEVAVNVTPELRARLAQTGRGASAFGFAAGSITVSVGGLFDHELCLRECFPPVPTYSDRRRAGMGSRRNNLYLPLSPLFTFEALRGVA